MNLYTYCVRVDNGSAPNPFWGLCTLAICKPVIRRTAKKGDWVVGTGSSKFGFENQVVYAMEVSDVMTLQEYDRYCQEELPVKIPDINSSDTRRKLGDCIYAYEEGRMQQRAGVHDEDNVARDLGGQNVLISKHFFYFGRKPVALPDYLKPIVRNGQGHRSSANAPYLNEFLDWIYGLKLPVGMQGADPYNFDAFKSNDCFGDCAKVDRCIDDEDEEEEVGSGGRKKDVC